MEGLPDSPAIPLGVTGQGDRPAAAGDPMQRLTALAARFGRALDGTDPAVARRVLRSAVDAGLPVGRLYVELVRPALAGHDWRPGGGRSLTVEAIVSDLLRALPLASTPGGAGRAAVVSCSETGIETLDGAVAAAFLEADGWRVGAANPAGVWETVRSGREGAVELAVAVASGPQDILRFAPVCAELRRLADPPVIVFCDFSASSLPPLMGAPGADAVAADPQDLLRCAAHGLPPTGRRRWGVRLSRSGATLSITPTGSLDAVSVARLNDVAVSRAGSYSRLVVDLRDLADVDPAGALELGTWAGLASLHDVELLVLAGAPRRLELGTRFPLCVREQLDD